MSAVRRWRLSLIACAFGHHADPVESTYHDEGRPLHECPRCGTVVDA